MEIPSRRRAELAEELKKIVPSQWHSSAYVAGGYAAAPHQAADIDIWILGVGALESAWSLTEDLKATFENVPGYLAEGAVSYPDGDTSPHPFAKVAESMVEMPPLSPRFGWMKVQLMATPFRDVQELLSYFDLSVHKFAWQLTKPEELIAAPDATQTYEPIRITRFDTPAHTLSRAAKLEARYKVHVNVQDLAQLQELRDVTLRAALGVAA